MKLEGFEGQNEWFSMSVGGGCRQWSVIVRVYPKKLMSQSPSNWVSLSLSLLYCFFLIMVFSVAFVLLS